MDSSTSENEAATAVVSVPARVPRPQEIFDNLNGVIVGHYVMKKALCVSIYNHYRDKLQKR